MTEFSHVDEEGGVRMVDVGAKPLSRRRATARALLTMASETASRLRELPKGDALATAQIAGVMAAKRTSDLIPMCHPLSISSATVDVQPTADGSGLEVTARVRTQGPTGVEMEALTAASVALLTLYDMLKAADKAMTIQDVRLIEKSGGASGDFRRG